MHNDLSKQYGSYFICRYFLALKDFHHANYTYDTIKNILLPQFQSGLEHVGRNNNFKKPFEAQQITLKAALNVRKNVETWDHKYYPETLEENKQIFDNYLTLLDQYKIRPILFLTPMIKFYKDHFNRKILNELFAYLNELSNKHSFIFLNCWLVDGFDDHDFYDETHMNARGASKFTKILNDLIMKLESE